MKKLWTTTGKILAGLALLLAPALAHADILGAPGGSFIYDQGERQVGSQAYIDSMTVTGPFRVKTSTAIFESTMTLSGNRPVDMATPTNGQALVWDSASGFWKPGTVTGGGGGTTIWVQAGDVDVDVAVSTIDFSTSDFTVTSSPAGEANISLLATNSKFIQNRDTLQSGSSFYALNGTVEFLTVNSTYTGTGTVPFRYQNNAGAAVGRAMPIQFNAINSTASLVEFGYIDVVTREVTNGSVNGQMRFAVASDSVRKNMLEISSESGGDQLAVPNASKFYFGTNASTGAYVQSSGSDFTIGLGSSTGNKSLYIGDGNGNVGVVSAVFNTATNDGTLTWTNSSNQFSSNNKWVFSKSGTGYSTSITLNDNATNAGAFSMSGGTSTTGAYQNTLTYYNTFYTQTFGVFNIKEQFLYAAMPTAGVGNDSGSFYLYASTIPLANNLQVTCDGMGNCTRSSSENDAYIRLANGGIVAFGGGGASFAMQSGGFRLDGKRYSADPSGGPYIAVNDYRHNVVSFHGSSPTWALSGLFMNMDVPTSLYPEAGRIIFGGEKATDSLGRRAEIISDNSTAADFSLKFMASRRADEGSEPSNTSPEDRMWFDDNCVGTDCFTHITDNLEIRKTYGSGELRFSDSDLSHYVAFKASETVTSSMTIVLPASGAAVDKIFKVTAVNGTRVDLGFADDGGASGNAIYPSTGIPNFPFGLVAGATFTINGVDYYFPSSVGSGDKIFKFNSGTVTLIDAITDAAQTGQPNTFSEANVFTDSATFSGPIILGGSAGTSGQFIKSNGDGLAPSWATASGSGDSVKSATETFSGAKTHTSPSGLSVTYGVSVGSATINDLTASRPVLTDSSKKLVSGQIDLANSNHVTGTLDMSANTNLTGGRSTTMNSDALDADAELYTDGDGWYIENPTASDDFKSSFVAPVNLTITKIHCESDQTVNFDLQVDDGSPTGVNGSDIACTSTFSTDSSLAGDTTMAAGDRLDIAITSVSGTPTWVAIRFDFTKDD